MIIDFVFSNWVSLIKNGEKKKDLRSNKYFLDITKVKNFSKSFFKLVIICLSSILTLATSIMY